MGFFRIRKDTDGQAAQQATRRRLLQQDIFPNQKLKLKLMMTQQERFCQVPAQKMEHLMGCATRASGLMHLLAVATVNAELKSTPPTDEAAEGIIWLAMHTGDELKAAMDDAFSGPPVTLQTSAKAAR